MIVRRATRDDTDAVLELWQRNRSLAAVTPDTPEAVAQLLDHDPEALLVAEENGRVVATAIVAWDGWRGGMYRLAVDAPFRRQGIASELMVAAERSLHARGCRRISVLVGAGEDEALGFWVSHGYEHDRHIVRLVKNVVNV